MAKEIVLADNTDPLNKEARHQIVAKDVSLIQQSKKTLSVIENKAVSYVISKIKKDDDIDKEYQFDCAEFYQLLGWRMESYSFLRLMMIRIASTPFSIWDPDTKTEKLVHWFNTIHLVEGKDGKPVDDTGAPSRYIKIRMHQDVMDYLFRLQDNKVKAVKSTLKGSHFVSYPLQSITFLKHQYSQNLFEVLLSYANNSSYVFECGTGSEHDIQQMIAMWRQVQDPEEPEAESKRGPKKKTTQKGAAKFEPVIPKSWSRYHEFDRLVLKPAKEEINKYTDLTIDYKPSKVDLHKVKHRKYVAITFYISRKTKREVAETDRIIDNEYERLKDDRKYHQMNMFELVEEAAEQPQEEPQEVDPGLVSARNILSEYGYSVYEIDRVMTEALKHRLSRSSWEDRYFWAIDYAQYYCEKIKDDPEGTKTTNYRRLMDLVRNDYDEQAEKITAWMPKPERIAEDQTEVVHSDGVNPAAIDISKLSTADIDLLMAELAKARDRKS